MRGQDYSNCFGEGVDISRNWATTHFLAFYGQPWNYHGAGGRVIYLTCYSEHMVRFKAH